MTLKIVLAFGAVLAMCVSARASLLYTESFESSPGAYSLNTAFDDGFFDFFDRYSVPDNTNAARGDFQNGWDGDFGILGMDHNGDGGPATVSIDISGINIAGQVDLGVRILFGALDSEPLFNNYEAADGDGIEVYASIDAATFVLVGAFKPNTTGSGDLYRDGNLDGVGEGSRLTVDLADFLFLIAGSGSSLDLSIKLTSTSSFEPLAVDSVRVFANASASAPAPVPEPNTLALLLVGSLLVVPVLLHRRRARR